MSGDDCQNRIQGVRYLKRIFPIVLRLRGREVARDKAGNRRLHLGEFACLILLSMFNPLMQSLRGLQKGSDLKRVQKILKCGRHSLGSLSESAHVFDPEVLEPLIKERLAALPRSHRRFMEEQTIPEELAQQISLCDSTTMRALAQITDASINPRSPHGWKLHTQFSIWKGVPESVTLTNARGQNESDERIVLASKLESDRLYVMDSGYEKYAMFNQIVACNSSYVCRARPRTVQSSEPRPLSPEAIEAGVVEDAIVTLGSPQSRAEKPSHPVRRIVIQRKPAARPRSDRPSRDQIILLTNLIDVPAEIVAQLYQNRWTIELFFRFFKHVLGCRKLISEHPYGITLQVYCAILACLLMAQVTGGSLTRGEYELIGLYMIGWADEDELITGLEKLQAARKTQK